MKLHTILSSAALVAAIAFSGAASAQNMISVEVPSDKVQGFMDACAALGAKDVASLTTSSDDNDVDATTTGSTAADASGQVSSPDPASQDYWDNLMASITIEQCEAGGFVTAE